MKIRGKIFFKFSILRRILFNLRRIVVMSGFLYFFTFMTNCAVHFTSKPRDLLSHSSNQEDSKTLDQRTLKGGAKEALRDDVEEKEETRSSLPTLQGTPSYGHSRYRKYRKLKSDEMAQKLNHLRSNLSETSFEDFKTIEEKEEKELSTIDSGSLWLSENQGAYLFSENTLRNIGDPIKVILDGNPRQQLLKKKDILTRILLRRKKRLNARRKMRTQYEMNPIQLSQGEIKKEKKSEFLEGKDLKDVDLEKKMRSPASFKLESISSKIIKKLPRGYYKIRGFETILIDERQYNVLVIGVVRPQDLVENKVKSTKLIDSYFDIVRYKKRVRF